MSDEMIRDIVYKIYHTPIEVKPYGEVKKRLDRLANETAYTGAILYSKLFKSPAEYALDDK